MVANRLRGVAGGVLIVALGAFPARAEQTGGMPNRASGPIAASATRISAATRLSTQGAPQHYKNTCGKTILVGLMIGAGIGATYGLMIGGRSGEPKFVPALALLGGGLGANVGYFTCR